MGAAKKIADSKILQELVPLNALSPERFREVSEKLVIEELRSGRYLFRKGDRDNQSIYLLEGKVNLIDGKRKVTCQVESGTDISRYSIANQQPRTLSARAATKVVIARIDSGLLDVFLTWDQSNHAEAVEIGADDNEDWMTRILQSGAFIKIPPSMIQSLVMRMQTFQVKAGEVVIKQGDEGDYFYTLDKGRCAVTRKESPDSEDLWLAELSDGDSFGEEALVSDAKRNATVTMLTDGKLMRLAKKDFVEFMKKPLVNYVDYDKASAMVDKDAVWLDVRTPDEYESSAFEDSVNIPLSSLRGEIPELVFNAKYIICCDTGRRSDSAAFILSHKGFDVYVLEGGYSAMMQDEPGQGETGQERQVANVIEFDSGVDSSGKTAVRAASQAEEVSGSGPVAETEVVVAALREQKESLEEEVRQYQSTEASLVEQLEQLRGELGESGEKLGTLYAQSKSDADDQQLLRDQYAALQEGYEGQLASVRQELETERQAAETSLADQRAQLQQELENSGGQVAELEAAVAAANKNNAALVDQSETNSHEQHELVGVLQQERDLSQQRAQQLQDELATLAEEKQALEGQLQAAMEEQQSMSDKSGEELVSVQQAVEQQLVELQEARQQDQEQLLAVTGEKDSLVREMQALQDAQEKLRAEHRQIDVELKEQKEHVENQSADMQANDEVLEKQQAEWDAERNAHSEATETAQVTIEQLREDLQQEQEKAAAQMSRLQEEFKDKLDKTSEQLEHHEFVM